MATALSGGKARKAHEQMTAQTTFTTGQTFIDSITDDTITITKVGPKTVSFTTGAYTYRWPHAEALRAVEQGHWQAPSFDAEVIDALIAADAAAELAAAEPKVELGQRYIYINSGSVITIKALGGTFATIEYANGTTQRVNPTGLNVDLKGGALRPYPVATKAERAAAIAQRYDATASPIERNQLWLANMRLEQGHPQYAVNRAAALYILDQLRKAADRDEVDTIQRASSHARWTSMYATRMGATKCDTCDAILMGNEQRGTTCNACLDQRTEARLQARVAELGAEASQQGAQLAQIEAQLFEAAEVYTHNQELTELAALGRVAIKRTQLASELNGLTRLLVSARKALAEHQTLKGQRAYPAGQDPMAIETEQRRQAGEAWYQTIRPGDVLLHTSYGTPELLAVDRVTPEAIDMVPSTHGPATRSYRMMARHEAVAAYANGWLQHHHHGPVLSAMLAEVAK